MRSLYKLRAGAFGLIVVEHADLFTIPYVPLPRTESYELAFRRYLLGDGEHIALRRWATAEPSTPEPSAKELRERKTREAQQSAQPFEWASHVYVTVGGEVRWRCCGNLFDDDHSPYCQNPDSGMGRGW